MRNPIKERVIPMRIVILREKMGLKQTEFVEALNEKYDICNLSVSDRKSTHGKPADAQSV
jgi:hypothetical protein